MKNLRGQKSLADKPAILGVTGQVGAGPEIRPRVPGFQRQRLHPEFVAAMINLFFLRPSLPGFPQPVMGPGQPGKSREGLGILLGNPLPDLDCLAGLVEIAPLVPVSQGLLVSRNAGRHREFASRREFFREFPGRRLSLVCLVGESNRRGQPVICVNIFRISFQNFLAMKGGFLHGGDALFPLALLHPLDEINPGQPQFGLDLVGMGSRQLFKQLQRQVDILALIPLFPGGKSIFPEWIILAGRRFGHEYLFNHHRQKIALENQQENNREKKNKNSFY